MAEFHDFTWKGITYPTAYLRTLFDFARAHQFRSGLEIGFDQGASSLALLRGSPEAKLSSIDIYPCEEGRARVATSEVNDRHTFYHGDSREYLKTIDVRFDLIYIDGDHLYDAVLIDIENATKLLEYGGVILLDDCDPGHGHFGVYKAAQDFCMKNKGWFIARLEGSPSQMCTMHRI